MATSAAKDHMPMAQGALYEPAWPTCQFNFQFHLFVSCICIYSKGVHSLAAQAALYSPTQAPGSVLGWCREEDY